MATYLQQFQSFLEAEMAKGGTPEQMEQCVTEYNRTGSPTWTKSEPYAAWVKTASFACVDCHTPYNTEDATPTDETRCTRCRKGSDVASAEG